MKNLLFLPTLLLSLALGQQIDSLQVLPEVPASNQPISVLGMLSADSGRLSRTFFTVTNPTGNLIVVDACYQYDTSNSANSPRDTFLLGEHTEGTWRVQMRLKLHTPDQASCGSAVSDTLSAYATVGPATTQLTPYQPPMRMEQQAGRVRIVSPGTRLHAVELVDLQGKRHAPLAMARSADGHHLTLHLPHTGLWVLRIETPQGEWVRKLYW